MDDPILDEAEQIAEAAAAARRMLEWRVSRALDDAPEQIGHVRAMIMPGGAQGYDMRVSGSKEPPAPMRLEPLDDSDEAYAQLVSWAWLWAERLDMEPPVSAAVAWHNLQGEVGGFPPDTDPQWAFRLTAAVTYWLTRHASMINAQDLSADYLAEVLDTLENLSGRYRMEPKPSKAMRPGVCPLCGKVAVRASWWSGDERDVTIRCEECQTGTDDILAASHMTGPRMSAILTWVLGHEQHDETPFDPTDPEHVQLYLDRAEKEAAATKKESDV